MRILGVVRVLGAPSSGWQAEDGMHMQPALDATGHARAFTLALTTNRCGWRGPEFDAAPAGTPLSLGDSHTRGHGVEGG